MNTKKTIFAIITSIALLLATLCGCMETNDTQTNKEGYESIGPISPLFISINGNTNFKDEMIKHIEKSKTMSKENEDEENYGLYYIHKISTIKEFYLLDNLIIEDYRLYAISVNESIFLFRFVPIDNWKDEGPIEQDINDIWMSIDRTNEVDKSDPLKSIIENIDLQGERYLYEGDMLFFPAQGNFYARMDDTLLYIRLPREMYDHEYLRDLAFKVIETAELVVVGE